ncbi:acetyl-CoA sensor PanZ family protein [Pseudomonas triticicola]|uniref:acetyl-CoA sensor PanZ family protein n=1 Tax=Pseudomonas triticicola TaxID=2842345 RepID=UPI003EBD03D5
MISPFFKSSVLVRLGKPPTPRLQRHHAVCYLSHLCVRKVTRPLGVAERLVNQAQKMASQAGAGLRPLAPTGHPQAQAPVTKLQGSLPTLGR